MRAREDDKAERLRNRLECRSTRRHRGVFLSACRQPATSVRASHFWFYLPLHPCIVLHYALQSSFQLSPTPSRPFVLSFSAIRYLPSSSSSTAYFYPLCTQLLLLAPVPPPSLSLPSASPFFHETACRFARMHVSLYLELHLIHVGRD